MLQYSYGIVADHKHWQAQCPCDNVWLWAGIITMFDVLHSAQLNQSVHASAAASALQTVPVHPLAMQHQPFYAGAHGS